MRQGSLMIKVCYFDAFDVSIDYDYDMGNLKR